MSRRPSLMQVENRNDGVLRSKDDSIRRLSHAQENNLGHEIFEAKNASSAEKEMSVRDSLRLYKKAVCYSLIMSLAVVMEGYDLSLMGSFMGYKAFKDRYGTELDPSGNKIISAAWQTGLQNGTQVGSIIGLALNGYISEWFGYKKTMLGSLVLMAGFICLPFFAKNVETVLAGAILQGIPWGVFQTLTVSYASDVTPTNLRAYLTTYVNLCWVIGQFTAAGVLKGCSEIVGEWSYRIPFAVQWAWIPFIFIGAVLAPESPWWCVRQGRYEEARRSLLALTSTNCGLPFDVDAQVSMIKATNELEKAMSEGTEYHDCFRGIDLRRTEIASIAWVAQAFSGSALMGYSVQFYQSAGMDQSNALSMNLGQYAMGACGTVASWFLMNKYGRRDLYFWGLIVLFAILMIVGGVGTLPRTNVGAQWCIGSLLLIYTFVYDFTIGPVCYSLVSEIPSTRLKIKTVVIARSIYNVAGIINNVIMPLFLSENELNWGAKTGFFWAGMCALLALWTYFRLPEPKDRTFAELDVLFENRVSARKFKRTPVDQFSGHHLEIVTDDMSSGEKQVEITKF